MENTFKNILLVTLNSSFDFWDSVFKKMKNLRAKFSMMIIEMIPPKCIKAKATSLF